MQMYALFVSMSKYHTVTVMETIKLYRAVVMGLGLLWEVYRPFHPLMMLTFADSSCLTLIL